MSWRERPVVALFLQVAATTLLLLALVLLATLGGVLNRCRGGFWSMKSLPYWVRHDLSREVFSIPTGFLVMVLGKHFKAGLVVWLLTQCSLFVGWGTYMNIGTVATNYMSREGIFDWLLGRQTVGWEASRRFVREYTGMSLRGLVWTLPQGYALQQLGFGWQYSLSGSLMAAFYYAGSQVNCSDKHLESNETYFFDSPIAHSEFYWGTFVWFVLITSCLAQLVHCARRWVYRHSICSVDNPYTCWELFKHASLNRYWIRVSYEALVVLLWCLFMMSVIVYSVTIPEDISNKGMTFAGLFLSVVALAFFAAWSWAIAYVTHKIRRSQQQRRMEEARKGEKHRADSRINDIHHLEGVRGRGRKRVSFAGEEDPLLPWPYSHPDKAFANQTPSVLERGLSSIESSRSPYSHQGSVRQPPNGGSHLAFILLWPAVEKWLYLDVFSWLRHLIGFMSVCATVVTLVLTLINLVVNLHSPRFDPNYVVCFVGPNATNITIP